MKLFRYIKKHVYCIIKPIVDENKTLFVLLFILNLNIIGPFYLHNVSENIVCKLLGASYQLLPAFSLIFALICILHVIPNRIMRFTIKALVVFFSGIISLSDWFLFYQYQGYLDQGNLGILAGTNPVTVKNFICTYVFSLPVVVGICTGIGVLLLLLYLVHKYEPSIQCYQRICITLFFSVISLIIIAGESIIYDVEHKLEISGWKYEVFYNHLAFVRITCIFDDIIDKFGNEDVIYSVMDDVKKQEFVENGNADVPYVVFVLGESVDRNHMSVYGYNLPTTPNLQKRVNNGEVALFDDTIACGNTTAVTMSMIFTMADKNYDKHWYDYPCLMDILRSAGYYTVWLSNQEPVGRWGNFDRYYAMRSDDSHFMHISDGVLGGNIENLEYDEYMLPYLDDYLKKNNYPKQFFVIHMAGAHEIFSTRYTKAFAKFTSLDEIGPYDNWKKTQAEYDNAVLYGDYVFDEIIKRFEDKNAIVFYISDHGMDLYDTVNFAGHTAEEKGSYHMIEIPFAVWGSKTYREGNSVLWTRILSAVHQPYRTDYLIYTVMEAIGVTSSSYKREYSVINESYLPFERVYGGKIYKRDTK